MAASSSSSTSTRASANGSPSLFDRHSAQHVAAVRACIAGIKAELRGPKGAAMPLADQITEQEETCAPGEFGEERYVSRWVVCRGSESARFVLLGEAPGAEEAASGLPFVGESGRLLAKMVEQVRIDLGKTASRSTTGGDEPDYRRRCRSRTLSLEDDFLITNCVFARPPGNRDPTALELLAYAPYVRRLIETVRPEAVVCIGRFAASLMRCGFDVHRMYLKRAGYRFSEDEPEPSFMVRPRVDEGRVSAALIGDRLPCRMVVMTHPAYFLHSRARSSAKRILGQELLWIEKLSTALSKAVAGCLLDGDQPRQSPCGTPFDVRQHMPGFRQFEDESSMCASSQDFVRRYLAEPEMQQIVRRVPAEHQGSGASRLVPVQQEFCALVKEFEYDRAQNCFYLYATRPNGDSCRMVVRNFRFDFWFTPHVAFSQDWSLPLTEHSLDVEFLRTLETVLNDTLAARAGRWNDLQASELFLRARDVRLSYDRDKRVLQEGYQPQGRTMIRCSVPHYLLIKDVLKVLQHLVREYTNSTERVRPVRRGRGKRSASVAPPSSSGSESEDAAEEDELAATAEQRRIEQKFQVCEAASFSPEEKLSFQAGIKASHWHRFRPARRLLKRRTPVPWRFGLQHCYEIDDVFEVVQCLMPNDAVPLGDPAEPAMTSSDHAKAVFVSSDIECCSLQGNFPNPFYDPVTTVSCVVQCRNSSSTYAKGSYLADQGYWTVTFCLGETSEKRLYDPERRRSRRYWFADERSLLEAWQCWMMMTDPDYLAGHNWKRFDMWYLVTRIHCLNATMGSLGRGPADCLRIDQRKFQSRAFGERIITLVRGLSGCVLMDTLEIYLREKKLSSYKLDAIAQQFLGARKEDVPYAAIPGLFCGTPADREHLAVYCDKDARLVDQLINRDAWLQNTIEFARVTGSVTENGIYVEGQQKKVLGAVMHRNMQRGHPVMIATPEWWTRRHNQDVMDHRAQLADLDELMVSDDAHGRENEGSDDFAGADDNEIQSVMERMRMLTIDSYAELAQSLAGEKAKGKGKEKMASNAATRGRGKPRQRKQRRRRTVVGIERAEAILKGVKRKRDKERKENAAGVFGRAASSSSSFSSSSSSSSSEAHERFAKMRAKLGSDKLRDKLDTLVSLAEDEPELMQQLDESAASLEDLLAEADEIKSSLARGDAAYQGATVMPSKPGFYYRHPVICVDFASLYPSIMLCFWICLMTKVFASRFARGGGKVGDVTPEMCNRSPVQGVNPETGRKEDIYFVKREHAESLLPDTEQVLLAARKEAKKKMFSYAESVWCPEKKDMVPNPNHDPVLEAVFTGRQGGLKILANSMYGAMGANGLLGDQHCAETVTAYGRELIGIVKDQLEKHYNTNCVGGDTDSVFEMFDERSGHEIRTVPEAEAFAKELERFLNQFFTEPVRIEYEKSMFPMLVLGKKRYCGIIWEIGKKPRFFSKGMETIRRDSLPYTKDTMKQAMAMFLVPRKIRDEKRKMLEEETMEEYERAMEERITRACEYIRERAKQLLEGRVPMVDLILSKQLSREVYANDKQEHLTVVRNMVARGEDPPKLGERVPYCYVVLPHDPKTRKERKGYEIVEHPDYAIRSGMRINYAYYLDHKFKDPIVRVMRHVLKPRMIERVIKRLPQAARQNMEVVREATSMERLTEETERYLFSIARKRTKLRANVQSRYVGLSARVASAKPTQRDSPMLRALAKQSAQSARQNPERAREWERRQLESELRGHYELPDLEDAARVAEAADARLARAKAEKDARLQVCRDCVKRRKIYCTAYGCKEYFPRIEAQAAHRREKEMRRKLDEAQARDRGASAN